MSRPVGVEVADRFVVVSGRRVFVRIWRPVGVGNLGSDLPLVLLHHGLGSVSQWRDFPDQLAAATGRPIIAYDRLGYGRSDDDLVTRTSSYMQREAWEILPAVLADIDVGPRVLLGHSEGGSIALLHAGRYTDEVAGVVVEAAHVYVEESNLAEIERVAAEAARSGLKARLAKHHGHRAGTVLESWSSIWLSADFRRWSIRAELQSVTCPTLALVGADDPYVSAAQLEALVEGIAGPVIPTLMPGVGHAPHHENRAATLDLIAGILDQVVPPGRRAD